MFERWKERVAEFADAHFVTSGPTVGTRESRRILGHGTLTADDVLNARPYSDAIAKGYWYVDIHPTDGLGFHKHVTVGAYDISYHTLLPRNI